MHYIILMTKWRRKLTGRRLLKSTTFKLEHISSLAELVIFRCSCLNKKQAALINVFTEHCKRWLCIKVVRALLSLKTTTGSRSAIRNHHRAVVSSPVSCTSSYYHAPCLTMVSLTMVHVTFYPGAAHLKTVVQHVLPEVHHPPESNEPFQ